MDGLRRLNEPLIEYVELVVISHSAEGALRFFGFSEKTHEAIDLGPPLDPSAWKPGTRRWEVRPKKETLN